MYVMHVDREQPVINTQTVNLDYLQSLPDGTFGREYADWLQVNVCIVLCFCLCFRYFVCDIYLIFV